MMFYLSQLQSRSQFHALPRPVLRLRMLTFVLLLALLPTLSAMHLPASSNLAGSTRDVNAGVSRRTVYNPRILTPDKHSVWIIGSTVTVTWDTRDIPRDITNDEGKVVLGYIESGSTNEHLDLDRPLASNFDIRAGKISFKVPQVPPRSDYIVVLFGDSGNHSPTFRISYS